MSESNVLTSTEKLLDQIRNVPLKYDEKRPQRQEIAKTAAIYGVKKNSLTAGVFIHDNFVTLVLTGQTKANAPKILVKWAFIPFPDSLEITSKRFPAFLRKTIKTFLDRYKKVPVWSAIATKDLKFRNIIVPNLPESKLATAALWNLKKEFEINENEEIFDFQVAGDTEVDGVKKKKLVAFTGQKEKIAELKALFDNAGFKLSGITAIPFAFQNFFRNDPDLCEESPFILVNILKENSDVMCFSGSDLLLIRNIRTGASGLFEELLESPEDTNADGEQVTDLLSSDVCVEDQQFETIEEDAQRFVGKIVRTGEYCSFNVAGNTPMKRYLFFGHTGGCATFMEYAKTEIPAPVDLLSPFSGQTQPALNIELPVDVGERAGVVSAISIALSSKLTTPNFLHTYEHKAIEARYAKMNIAIVGIFAVCLVICMAGWIWLSSVEKSLLAQNESFDTILSKYHPSVSQKLLIQRIGQARKRSEQIKNYTKKYLPLGIITEICLLTPDSISLISLDGQFPDISPSQESLVVDAMPRRVTLKGRVLTNLTFLESTLTGFILKLDDSPLFKKVVVEKKEIMSKDNNSFLHFTAVMEVM